MRLAAPASVVAAALACGCSSQWFEGYEHSDIAHTDVVIRTEPSGAQIYMTLLESPNTHTTVEARLLDGLSPVRQPIEYDHVDTLWERQQNYGSNMREQMGTIAQILTFPVWAVASLFHYREEKHRHEYGSNTFLVTAHVKGREDAETTIVLEGEAEKRVLLKLPPEVK
jgi:hypothetical protein